MNYTNVNNGAHFLCLAGVENIFTFERQVQILPTFTPVALCVSESDEKRSDTTSPNSSVTVGLLNKHFDLKHTEYLIQRLDRHQFKSSHHTASLGVSVQIPEPGFSLFET